MFWINFLNSFQHYTFSIIPALLLGFFLSGIVHEFLPDEWAKKHLSGKGIKGVLYSTLIGTIVPVCCWGALPLAVSLRMKGASLGPILAILVATPATSINALIVTASLLGLKFALCLFFTVIAMGLMIGLIGNKLNVRAAEKNNGSCNCPAESAGSLSKNGKSFSGRMKSVLKFAYIDMPREIGKEILLGLVLAALVSSLAPLGALVKNYLTGSRGYLFALIFGLLMYMCATMSVPLVDALIGKGLDLGAGFMLLLIGPITSYGTILVLWKEFGLKILALFLSLTCALALVAGAIYSLI